MAARLTPGALGWRKGTNTPATVSPRIPSTPATPPPSAVGIESATPPVSGAATSGDHDHTEALERWASTAHERPLWMRDPEALDGPTTPTVPAHAVEANLRAFPHAMSGAATGSPAAPAIAELDVPDFDDATDRFAQYAMRSADAQSLFSRDDYEPPAPSVQIEGGQGPTPVTEQPGSDVSRSGWRPDDVHVSVADMDADAMRLEALAARASETRESHGDFAMPAGGQPFTGLG
ncbi:MAG: hypothetical protein QOC60_1979, partial [Frankiaceae bacterium]|nr:hypothetical protein [Frankiaceae bacterium]